MIMIMEKNKNNFIPPAWRRDLCEIPKNKVEDCYQGRETEKFTPGIDKVRQEQSRKK